MKIFFKKELKGKQIKLTIHSQDGKPLTTKQIKLYGHQILKQYNITNEKQLYIRGLNDLGFFTLKSLNSNIDYIDNDEDEYLDGRVKDPAKFKEYFQAQYVLFR